MKRLFLLSCLFLTVLILGSSQALAQGNYPEPKGYVNDFASIIPDDIEQKMEQNLRDYEAKTTNEIAVVTVTSLEGLSIEDYTMGLAEKWGVGKKDKDNGVILLVAPNERAVRIEVGYGLEPVLTDIQAKRIIDAMIPYFKESKYAQGIELGVQKITDTLGYLTPEEKAAQQKDKEARDKAVTALFLKVLMWLGAAVVLIIAIIIVWKAIVAWGKERKRQELLREKVRVQIPEVKKQKKEVLHKLYEAAEKIQNKYLPIHHSMARNAVSRGKELSQRCDSLLDEAARLIAKEPDAAYENLVEVKGLQVGIQGLKDELTDFDQRPKKIADNLGEIKKRIEIISVIEGTKELALLKQEAPLAVWAEIEQNLNQAETLRANLQKEIGEAERLNSSSVQDFAGAEAKLALVPSLIRNLEIIVEAPGKTMQEFLAAQRDVPTIKEDLIRKIKEAEQKIKDSDAGDEPKRFLTQSREKKSEAEKEESAGIVNWLLVSSLLLAAVALAEKSRSEADHDVSAAYHRRHDSSSSWSSSSYSSSGSFGGFGGGGFGGGGASGHW